MGSDRSPVCFGQFFIKRIEMCPDGEFGEQGHGFNDFGQIGFSGQIAFNNGAYQKVPYPAHCSGQGKAVADFMLEKCGQVEPVQWGMNQGLYFRFAFFTIRV